jgi:hypothetical protein
MKHFLPPPVTPSGEEPIAAGGRQNLDRFKIRSDAKLETTANKNRTIYRRS